MNRPMIFAYQMLTGLSDASTGALLIIAPVFTLRLMGLHVPADSLPFLSFIGAFVLSVGLSCLYGAFLIVRCVSVPKLEMVWLLTALTRSGVAIFIVAQILTQTLEAGWVTVALSDGACVLIQAIGLRKGWLAHAAR
jgi:hypothetical protein